MKTWLRILPYGLVVWLAKRHLERFPDVSGMEAVNIFPGEMLCFEKRRKAA